MLPAHAITRSAPHCSCWCCFLICGRTHLLCCVRPVTGPGRRSNGAVERRRGDAWRASSGEHGLADTGTCSASAKCVGTRVTNVLALCVARAPHPSVAQRPQAPCARCCRACRLARAARLAVAQT
jgi:hypothetical protein